MHLALEVLGGKGLQRHRPVRPEALEVVVPLLEDERHPADLALDDDELQTGEPLEHAREDDVHQRVRDAEQLEIDGAAVRLDGAPTVQAHRAVVEAREDVQVDGHLQSLGRLPERVVVVRRERQVGVRDLPDEPADHPALLAPLELADRVLDVVGGEACDAEEPVRRDGAVAHQPVVVELERGFLGLGVLHAEQLQAQRRVEDLGAHSVLGHLADALRRVEAAGARLVQRALRVGGHLAAGLELRRAAGQRGR